MSQRKNKNNNTIQREKYIEMFDSDNYVEFYDGDFQNGGNQNSDDQNITSHCTYCGESCKSRTDMENHLKQHLQNGNCLGKYKCNICDEVCSSAVILAEHKLTHCKIISSNSCIHCKAVLTNKEQFYVHLVHHSSTKNINSNNNNEHNDNDNNNNKNISNENINNGRKCKTKVLLPTPCIVCRQTLVSDIEVKIHSQFHLNSTVPKKEYECCICKNFTDSKNVIISNSGTRYLCKDCYMSTEKPLMEYTVQCSKCKVTCSSQSVFTNRSQSVICGQCKLSDNENDFSPQETICVKSNSKNHDCHLCKGVFSSSVDLEIHLIEHTFVGYSSYTCYICSAVFTASQGLRNHILEHGLEARPYDCSKCGLKFFFRAQLENHNFVHEEKNSNTISNDISEEQDKEKYKVM